MRKLHLVLSLVLLLPGRPGTSDENHPRLRIGDEVPRLELPRLGGGGGKLSLSSLRGQVVALSFYGSFCAPCRKELPELNGIVERLNRDLPPKKRAVLLVLAIDEKPPGDAQRARLAPSAIWLHDASGKAREAFDPRTYPCTFLVDGEGIVRHINRGFGPGYPERVERWLRGMLSLPSKP
jgi:cytochrome c biogenesis protein CcmG, thiol:disulfide interchange protein DsbE